MSFIDSPDSPGGAGAAPPKRLVTVATYSEAHEAQIGRSALASHGIRSFIPDEHAATLNPHYLGAALGIRLQVPHADLERASEILRSAPDDADDEGAEEDDAAGDLDGPKCPCCEARYAYREWSSGELLVILLFLGLPLFVLEKRWHCRKCDAYWAPKAAVSRRGSPYRSPRSSALRDQG